MSKLSENLAAEVVSGKPVLTDSKVVLIKRYNTISFFGSSKMVDEPLTKVRSTFLRPYDIDDMHGLLVSQMVSKQEFETGKFSSDEQEYEYYDEQTEDFLDPSPLDSPYPLDSAEMSDIERQNESNLKSVRHSLKQSSVKSEELNPTTSEKTEQTTSEQTTSNA